MMEQPILTALYPAHAADLKVLLETFFKAKTLEFKQFRDIWKEMLFSTIHQGKASEGENQLDYVQSLFATALGFFQLNHSFEVRVGVLYALYLLYETQPSANTSSHKYKINVSLALWNDFQKLYEEIKQRKVVDAYAIFRKMQRERFFSIHAVLRSTPSSTNSIGERNRAFDDLTTDTIRNADTLTGVLDIEALERTESAYENSTAYQNVFNANADAASRPLAAELREVMVRHERTKYLRVTQQPPPPDRSRKKARSRKWPKGENSEAPQAASVISGNKMEDQSAAAPLNASASIAEGPFEDMPDLGTSVDQNQMHTVSATMIALIPPRGGEELGMWEAALEKDDKEKEKEKPEKNKEATQAPPPPLPSTSPAPVPLPPRRKAQPKQRAISTAVSGAPSPAPASSSPSATEENLTSRRKRSSSSAATSRSSARVGSRRNYHSVSTVYTYEDNPEQEKEKEKNSNSITETTMEIAALTNLTAEVTPPAPPATPPIITGTLLDLISPSPTKSTPPSSFQQNQEAVAASPSSLQPKRSTRKRTTSVRLRSSKELGQEEDGEDG